MAKKKAPKIDRVRVTLSGDYGKENYDKARAAAVTAASGKGSGFTLRRVATRRRRVGLPDVRRTFVFERPGIVV